MAQLSLQCADDMIFFIKPGESAQELREKIDNFLAEKTLNIKKPQTKLVKFTRGFDFLGWHFKVKAKNNKFLSYLWKDNHLKMITQIKKIMHNTELNVYLRLEKVKVK